MDQIGKYVVSEEIGQGGMGIVYKARDPVIGREVAVKVISERIMSAPNLRARFLREIASAGRLSHENIMTIYDAGDHDGRPYFVMELLSGKDLSEVIQEDACTLDEKLSIALQVASGLCYAHQRGVVHRDIKPDNVRVLNSGRAKIMDFGIARIESETHELTNTSIGTPRYMSPEQFKGKNIDQRTDIFSYGAVIYEFLSGQPAFSGERATTVMYKVLHEEPEPLQLGGGANMEKLRRIVERCLSKEATARYPGFEEVIADLETVIAKRQTSVVTLIDAPTLGSTAPRTDDTVVLGATAEVNPPSAPPVEPPRPLGGDRPAALLPSPKPVPSKPKSRSRLWTILGASGLVVLLLAFVWIRMSGEDAEEEKAGRPVADAPRVVEEPPGVALEEEAQDGSVVPAEETGSLQEDMTDPSAGPAEAMPPEQGRMGPSADDGLAAARGDAETQRAAARRARERAEQAGASGDAVERAAGRERAGGAAFRRGTASGYAESQTAYAEAVRLYDGARRDAEQRQQAERAQRATEQARSRVVARREEADVASVFGQAEAQRESGDRALRQGNFDAAAAAFEQAQTLYAAALAVPAPVRPTSEPAARQNVAPEPAAPEPSPEEVARVAAQQAADALAARLKRALEQEDAAAMRGVHSTYDGWEGFFRYAENVQATVSVNTVEVSGSEATAIVGLRIRFHNTSKNSDESTNVQYTWTLAQRGSTWALASVATR